MTISAHNSALKREAYNLRPLTPREAIEDILLVANEIKSHSMHSQTLRDCATLLQIHIWIYNINVVIAAGIVVGLICLGFRAITGL